MFKERVIIWSVPLALIPVAILAMGIESRGVGNRIGPMPHGWDHPQPTNANVPGPDQFAEILFAGYPVLLAFAGLPVRRLTPSLAIRYLLWLVAAGFLLTAELLRRWARIRRSLLSMSGGMRNASTLPTWTLHLASQERERPEDVGKRKNSDRLLSRLVKSNP